jgi:capsular polysaccharide transport system ATP-binding protein
MSIVLHNVTKRIGHGKYFLFQDLNFRIEVGRQLGILAQPKSGKTTLLRMICGTEHNYEGRIERNSTVSWPIPLGDFLVTSITVVANIRFIGRLYGNNNDDYVRLIAEIADITEFLNTELGDCPRFVRGQLVFALGVGTKFDIYLFDENIMTGDKVFKDKALGLVQSMAANHGIVLATSNFKEVAANCDAVIVLDGGRATQYENVDEGIKHFKSLTEKPPDEPAQQKEQIEADPVEMESALGI